jgi:enoyl-[acyl-carrier-protein] reductase (NADH)
MQPQPLSATETKLLNAFRALPADAKKQMFRTIEELAEALEDEQDAQDADRILALVKEGKEEIIPIDEVVKSLGLTPKKRSE